MNSEGEKSVLETSNYKSPSLPDPIPNYAIADLEFKLSECEVSSYEETKSVMMGYVEKNGMLPYYKHLCASLGWMEDEVLVEKLEVSNREELKGLEEKIEDAKENFGVYEVREALSNKAYFYCRIGDMEKAIETFEESFDKIVGAGTRLDTILTLIRIGFFKNDLKLIETNVQRAKDELEKGGDWERRNKLKVYEALYLIMYRKFKEASLLLLSSISTFTAVELISFENFIFYVITLSMLTLDRPTLRSDVISSPEVIQVITEDPDLKLFMNSFFDCKYHTFMQNLVNISKRVKHDRFLNPHYLYFIRNIRLKAYTQFLEPYKSVTLLSMSNSFGVSIPFIENELTSFIASGKLNCKVDKVNQIIESNNPDARNKIYQDILKKGDMLLNRIQRLSRVIDV